MILDRWKFEDILALSELEKECFPDDAWTYKLLVDSFQSPSFIGVLARDGGEVIGYGGITITGDTADIENIAVTEAYRKSGVATAVLANLLSLAKEQGVQKVFLEVRVSNAPAMKLYLKCGFVGVYARPRYYRNGEDCLVMSKSL